MPVAPQRRSAFGGSPTAAIDRHVSEKMILPLPAGRPISFTEDGQPARCPLAEHFATITCCPVLDRHTAPRR